MKYFSGFGLRNEFYLFENLLRTFGIKLNQYDIIGFDYGANLALQYAYNQIQANKRVGKIILLSPLIYTYNLISNKHDNISNTQINISCLQTFIQTLYKQNILQENECLTHAHFEQLQAHNIDLPPSKLKNIFISSCLYMYQNYTKDYLTTLYKVFGFQEDKIQRLFSTTNTSCKDFAYFEKNSTLSNLFYNKCENFDKITKKANLLITFLAENDRIINSKIINNYLSHFGICCILKNHNHLLRHH